MLKKLFFVATFSLIFTLFAGQRAEAATAPLSGFAWSSNIGWIQFNPSRGPGVSIDTATGVFSGFAWSSNIGWIDFNGTRLDGTNFARAVAPNPDGSSGWDGKIKLRGSVQGGGSYGVQVSSNGENLQGFAWGSDVVGWIKFCDSNYCVNIGGLIASCRESFSDPDGVWRVENISGGHGGYQYRWTVDDQLTSESSDTFIYPDIPEGIHTASVSINDNDGHTFNLFCPAIDAGGVGPGFIDPEFIPPVDGRNRMEISSQPLTSPAISSSATFSITHNDADTVVLRIRDIASVSGSGASLINNSGVQCRWSKTSPPSGPFTPCSGATVSLDQFETNVYLNIRVERPTQTIKNGNPYVVEVEMPDYPSVEATTAIFDYRVGTVNPI